MGPRLHFAIAGRFLFDPDQRIGLMTTMCLEAFSDAVIAIVITIMVLELPTPHVAELAALDPVFPVFLRTRDSR